MHVQRDSTEVSGIHALTFTIEVFRSNTYLPLEIRSFHQGLTASLLMFYRFDLASNRYAVEDEQ